MKSIRTIGTQKQKIPFLIPRNNRLMLSIQYGFAQLFSR